MSTITNANGVTTSDDAFVMADSHSVFGGDQGTIINSTSSQAWVDNGIDVDVFSANGTSSPTGIALTFANTDTNSDVGDSNETVTGGAGRQRWQ